MGSMHTVWTIGYGTWLEGVRNRLLLVVVAFALVLVALSVAAASVSFGERARLIIDVGTFFSSGLGGVMALALGISSFAAELRRHTAYPILARPIGRWSFVVGKFLGLAGVMAVVVTALGIATALIVWGYGAAVPTAFWANLWLNIWEIVIAVGLAILCSTFAAPALAATYAGGLLIAGHLSADLQRIGEQLVADGQRWGLLLQSAYYLLPDLHHLSLRTEAANHLAVPDNALLFGTGYALTYTTFLLVLSILIFERRRIL